MTGITGITGVSMPISSIHPLAGDTHATHVHTSDSTRASPDSDGSVDVDGIFGEFNTIQCQLNKFTISKVNGLATFNPRSTLRETIDIYFQYNCFFKVIPRTEMFKHCHRKSTKQTFHALALR